MVSVAGYAYLVGAKGQFGVKTFSLPHSPPNPSRPAGRKGSQTADLVCSISEGLTGAASARRVANWASGQGDEWA